MTGGIYLIINISNGRHYIGSANDLARRKREHFSRLDCNKHDNSFLQNDYNKCGKDSFKFIPVIILNENLLYWEQIILNKLYDNKKLCYNIARDVSAPMRGKVVSLEARQRMSDAQKGHTVSEETKLKLKGNKAHLGCKHSNESKKKMSESLSGRKLSEEHRNKISLSLKGNKRYLNRILSDESREKMSLSKISNKNALGNLNRRGVKLSDETKKRMSDSQKLRRAKESHD